jgi:hypothetical protein
LVVGGSDSIRLALFEAESECCTLLTRYLSLDAATPEFDDNLGVLCSDFDPTAGRCRSEFSFVTQAAPYMLRASSSPNPSTFEQQCQGIAPPPPAVPCDVVVASGASLEFTTTNDCCALVDGFTSATSEHSNRATPTAQSLTKALCKDQTCLDMFTASYASEGLVDSEFPAPPSAGVCSDVRNELSATCASLGDNAPVANVSLACCAGVEYFREEYAGQPAVGNAANHVATICNERSCFEGYSNLFGTDILENTCRNASASSPTAAPVPPPQRLLVASSSCEYDSYCVGRFCYPREPHADGTLCEISSGIGGRCSGGVCQTTPRCAEYDGGDVLPGGDDGICESFGLKKGTLVYVRPSPLSYFSLEDGDDAAYSADYALSTMHTFMQTQYAIAQHTFYECQLPHLTYACSITYPRCNIVDQDVGEIVEFDELEHGYLVSRAGSGTGRRRRRMDESARYAAVPGATCEETCQHRNARCESSDDFLELTMDSPPARPQCVDGRYGDVGHPITAFDYYAQYNGQVVYPSETDQDSLVLQLPLSGYTDSSQRRDQVASVLGDSVPPPATLNVFCDPVADVNVLAAGPDSSASTDELLMCPSPYLARRDAGVGDVPCVLPCQLPVYSEAEMRRMWLAYITPGLIGTLLCVIELPPIFKKKIDSRNHGALFTLVYLSLAILFGLVDTIPVSTLFTDIPCGAGDTVLNKGEGIACTLNRVSVCLLLSIYYWMAAHCIYTCINVIPKFRTMKRHLENTVVNRWAVGICCGIPLSSAAVLLVCDTGNDPSQDDLYWAHLSRDMFTCSPRVGSLWLEIVCVHVHFWLCSLVIACALSLMGSYITSVVLKKAKGPGGSSSSPKPTTGTGKKAAVKKMQKTLSKQAGKSGFGLFIEIVQSCPRVFLTAVCMLLLLGVHTALAVMLIPRWEEFGSASEAWLECKKWEDACAIIEGSVGTVLECNGYRSCGELRATSNIPSVALLELYFFSRAGLVLIVGFTFFCNKKNAKRFLYMSHKLSEDLSGKSMSEQCSADMCSPSTKGRGWTNNPLQSRPSPFKSAPPSDGKDLELSNMDLELSSVDLELSTSASIEMAGCYVSPRTTEC